MEDAPSPAAPRACVAARRGAVRGLRGATIKNATVRKSKCDHRSRRTLTLRTVAFFSAGRLAQVRSALPQDRSKTPPRADAPRRRARRARRARARNAPASHAAPRGRPAQPLPQGAGAAARRARAAHGRSGRSPPVGRASLAPSLPRACQLAETFSDRCHQTCASAVNGSKSPSRTPRGGRFPPDAPARVVFAWLKYSWATGARRPALGALQEFVRAPYPGTTRALLARAHLKAPPRPAPPRFALPPVPLVSSGRYGSSRADSSTQKIKPQRSTDESALSTQHTALSTQHSALSVQYSMRNIEARDERGRSALGSRSCTRRLAQSSSPRSCSPTATPHGTTRRAPPPRAPASAEQSRCEV